MKDLGFFVLSLVATLATGFMLGWAAAHGEVATECQRQGGFYVGKTDFVCAVKP